jgi:citrate lyase synthetase
MPHTVFLVKSFTPTKSIYVEPVQDLNLNRRYISGHESQQLVTYNYNQSVLIILILPHNVIAVQHKQKTDTQTFPATVQLHYALHLKVS